MQTLSIKSPLAGAIQYTLTRWTALTRYVEDGSIEIDNNAAERAIRALVLGRRNYLVAGSDAGGETASRLYSLIGTCRLNGIDRMLICTMCSSTSPSTPSTASMSSCRGAWLIDSPNR